MKKFYGLVIILVVLFSLVACGQSNSASTDGSSKSKASSSTEEITFLANVTPNLTVEFYQSLINKFEKQNPNIKVNLIHAPDGNTTDYAKKLLVSGSFPDVINNVNAQTFIDANALLPLKPDSDWKTIKDWQKDKYWKDGKYYAFNPYIQPALLIYYNKNLFKAAGIIQTPKTWTEFFTDCKKLKDKGYTPIEFGGEWTTGFVYGEMISPTVFGTKQSWYKERYEGTVHFTDSYFQKATEEYANIIKDGYTNKGVLSLPYNSMDAEFAKGNIAMYPMGAWTASSSVLQKSGMDIGVFLPPTENGKTYAPADRSGAMVVSKTTKYSDAAIKFVKYMELNPNAHKELAQKDSLISNLQTPILYNMTPLQKEVFNAVTKADAVIGHYNGQLGGRGAVSAMYDAFGKVAQDIVLNENANIQNEMEYLDNTWDTNQKKDEQSQ